MKMDIKIGKYLAFGIVLLFIISTMTPVIQSKGKTIKIKPFGVFKNLFNNKEKTTSVISKFLRKFFANKDNKKGTHRGTAPIGTTGGVEVPTWVVGHYWRYNMGFGFDYNGLVNMNNAKVSNMKMEVVNIKDTDYIINLTSDGIEGDIEILNIIPAAHLKGNFDGNAVIDGPTLGIKKFEFHVSGKVKIPIIGTENLHFNLIMNFSKTFDFLNFPIEVGKDPWTASTKASVYMNGNVGSHKFSYSIKDSDFDDTLSCDDMKKVHGYNAFLISGKLGSKSELWYAPAAGYLVKVDEKIKWSGLDATYKLDIIDTNYRKENNNPPNIPDKPEGPSEGDTGSEYTYTIKTTDPDGDQVMYIVDWGDEKTTNTTFVKSGEAVTLSHTWINPGKYEVRAMAIDTNDAESEWSEPSYVNIGGEEVKGSVNLTVTIQKIKALDTIDPWYHSGSADWSYKLHVYNGYGWITRRYDCPSNHNTYYPKKSYKFKIFTGKPKIMIKLWDRDPVIKDPFTGKYLDYHDLADISSHPGGGKDNSLEDLRGAIYHGIYNLVHHKIDEDTNEENDYVKESNGYYITSGEYPPDYSDHKDENDAEVWFKVTDDYRVPTITISKPADSSYFYTGQPIEFEAKIDGGLAPFEWEWNFGDGNVSHNRKTTYTYKEAGDYFVNVNVKDNAGAESTSNKIIVHIFENIPPWNPDRPMGPSYVKAGKSYVYKTKTIDPENLRLEYGWDWDGDGVVDEWDNNNGNYYLSGEYVSIQHEWDSRGTVKIKVKARDIYGAESGWSPPLSVVVPYDYEKIPPTAVAKANPSIITEEHPSIIFDASYSHDNDENGKEIKWIRWDFDGDGIWDTGLKLTNHWISFDRNKKITKDFSYIYNDNNNNHATSLTYSGNLNHISEKMYYAKLEVKDNEGQTSTDAVLITIRYNQENHNTNHVPVADAGGPYSANNGEFITLDGSKSYDTDGDLLEYRWDIDGDGTYDTEWSSYYKTYSINTNDITNMCNSLANAGSIQHIKIYNVKLEVKDTHGATDTDTAELIVHYN